MYQRVKDSDAVKRVDDGGGVSFVPADEANADWRAYLAWAALGNEPLPAGDGA